ncbi:hypothetical protein BpHYR1_015257 [Brachionus plicatilis]|uniref:Uncharacterized protein n=1 Tax=Brachionus plicatilis TaxID=10195 RepID=A0A3M7Q3M9_BRAPC|nr:hypothetical protein BpHYR1_015257 [Brachionus plicatilis]
MRKKFSISKFKFLQSFKNRFIKIYILLCYDCIILLQSRLNRILYKRDVVITFLGYFCVNQDIDFLELKAKDKIFVILKATLNGFMNLRSLKYVIWFPKNASADKSWRIILNKKMVIFSKKNFKIASFKTLILLSLKLNKNGHFKILHMTCQVVIEKNGDWSNH